MARTARGAIAGLLALALGCTATLEADLAEDEANQVVVALHERGIGAQKEHVGGSGEDARFAVMVAPEEVAPALEVLRADGLPRRDDPGLHEVFGEGGLVPTATEERARYVAAMGGELARSIQVIDGVLDARVHLALPARNRFALDDAPPVARASVLIEYRGDAPPYDADAVRALVSGAVENMATENVAVIGVPTQHAAEPREAQLVSLGPVTVTRGTAGALKGILAGALGLHLVLAVLLVVAWRKKNRVPEPEEAVG